MNTNTAKKYVETNVPEHLKVHVIHLHQGNSSRNQRKGHQYVTVARLVDRKSDYVVSEGKACCSKNDNPRRDVGRQVAIGRALRDYNFQVLEGNEMQRAARAYVGHLPAFKVPSIQAQLHTEVKATKGTSD